jgi:hypothetical protein
MAEGRAQLKQKSNNRSQRLRNTPAFPIFHDFELLLALLYGDEVRILIFDDPAEL